MPVFRTQHKTDGKQSVTSGDSYVYSVDDSYRRLTGVDLVGDVEREIYVHTKDDNKIGLFGDAGKTISGEGDIDCEVELTKDDEVHIDYFGSADVSDVLKIRTDRPLQYRMEQMVEALETNEV